MSAREEFRSSSFRTRTGSICRGSGAFRFLVAHCRLSEIKIVGGFGSSSDFKSSLEPRSEGVPTLPQVS